MNESGMNRESADDKYEKTQRRGVIARGRNRHLEEKIGATREKMRDLEKRSSTDALTGLLRREEFTRRMKEMIGGTRKGDTFQGSVYIIMCDIDHFKAVNDTYGHPGGDAALQTVGKALREGVRASDIVGRYGGEEFVIGLSNGDKTQAKMIAEKLRKKIEDLTIDTTSGPVRVTMSFGVEEVKDQSDLVDALERADDALYKAKKDGRNRIVFFDKERAA